MLCRQDNEPSVQIVGHVRARARQSVDAMEIARLLEIRPQSILQLGSDFVWIPLQLLSTVLSKLCYRRLGRVPGARPVLVQIGGGGGKPAQRVAEHGWRLTRHDAPQLNAPVFESAMRRCRRRSGAQIDG